MEKTGNKIQDTKEKAAKRNKRLHKKKEKTTSHMPPRRDPARAARARERKEKKAAEKAKKLSDAFTEAGRAILDLVLDGGKQAQPSANLQRAMKEFESALEARPENADALYSRGRVYQEQGDLQNALRDYSACLTYDEQHVAARMQQGICYDMTGDSESAMASYSKVLEIEPRNDAAYNLRGCALLARRGGVGLKLRQVDFDAVLADFNNAVRCNENNFYALCNLGRLHSEHGFYDKAVQFYTRAMEVKDDYSYAAYRRGCAALTAVEEALRMAERASSLDPTAVVLNASCAAVPFSTQAPRDPARVVAPKNVPPSIFSLPPISSKARVAAGSSSSTVAAKQGSAQPNRAVAASSSSASAATAGSGLMQTASELRHQELEREAKKQIEREMAEEKQFAQLKHFLSTSITDFSTILRPLVEPEDRVKELPTLLHRAKAFMFEGDLEKAEDDINFARKTFDAYRDLQPAPPTPAEAVKHALDLMLLKIDQSKQMRRQGLPMSPFASGALTLRAAVALQKARSAAAAAEEKK